MQGRCLRVCVCTGECLWAGPTIPGETKLSLQQDEKQTTEGEMAGWHHRLDGHEFE